ncbi:MAG: hypothetical protein ABI760_14695, partial [Ferruginibacter sp.]
FLPPPAALNSLPRRRNEAWVLWQGLPCQVITTIAFLKSSAEEVSMQSPRGAEANCYKSQF